MVPIPARPDGKSLGTAFRVAPGYAVTAAHVIRTVGARVELRFEDGTSVAEVEVADPAPPESNRWDFDDHAVLRIVEPELVEAVPCVLLGEPVPEPGDKLLICAYNPGYVADFVENYRDCVVREPHPPKFCTIDGDRAVIQGMSGGPVWSMRQGCVFGLVKGSESFTAPQGGAVVLLLDGLRRLCSPELYQQIVTAHDMYHSDHQLWTDWLSGGSGAVRRRMIDLHGLLAQIPPGTGRLAPEELVNQLFRDFVRPRDAKRYATLRDLVEFLGTEFPRPNEALARFCIVVPHFLPELDMTVAEELRRIKGRMLAKPVLDELEQFLLAQLPDTAVRTTLFGVIQPAPGPKIEGRPPSFRYEVHRRFDDQEILQVEDEKCENAGEYATVKQDLKAALDRQLSKTRAATQSVEIVVALPDDFLTEEPLYEWKRPADARPFSKYVMRLRRSCTWEKDDEKIVEVEERYRRLLRQSSGGLVWICCSDPRAQELGSLQELFVYDSDDPGPHDSLAITEPPTVHALEASRSNALPVTLWRTERCPDHPAGLHCGGAMFRAELTTRLQGESPSDWHFAVWREQHRMQPSVQRDQFWRKIVFLFDKPGESRRRPPLAGPRMA
ncbi:serine protease [Nocardia sp. NPDC046763]|uniref:S1 family peptidase n=1 Tax=Nocardia sp. NPDC046763 TaxID=3155256 RepID=UPI0033ED0B67